MIRTVNKLKLMNFDSTGNKSHIILNFQLANKLTKLVGNLKWTNKDAFLDLRVATF